MSVSLAGCTTNETGSAGTSDDNETLGNISSGNEVSPGNETNTEDVEEKEEENGGEASELPENGAVVFVYDDGRIEDYTQAFPAHQAFDAPATTGIISENIGRTAARMDVNHLEELTAAGWEICSHTTRHLPLASYEFIADTEPDDMAIHATGYRHGYLEGLMVEITDGDRSVLREIAGLGVEVDGNRPVVLKQPVGESFAAGTTVIRFPEETMHQTLSESQRTLERLGFEVNTLLAPYDAFNEWSMKFVPEYYDGVANARPGSRINDPHEFDPYATRRHYFIEFTSSRAVKRDLDVIAEQGALGVLGAHTFKENVTETKIRETLEWVEKRDITVLTLRDAIELFAN